MRYILSAVVIAITVLFSLLYYAKAEPFYAMALRLNDLYYQYFRPSINDNILFIAIDEPSVNAYGRWPWRRNVVAQGLSHLTQADVVLLDMIFSEPTDAKNDAALEHALAHTNAICGFFLRHQATQRSSLLQRQLLFDSSLERLQYSLQEHTRPRFPLAEYAELNIEPIMSACQLSGIFSTFRDKDSLFRRYPIAFYYDKTLYPSLGVQALRFLKQQDILRENDTTLRLGKQRLTVDDEALVQLNFYAPQSYKHISFLDVASNKYSDDFFKNKIIIIGITEVGATDIRATPIGAISGALMHYTFISNFLNDEFLRTYVWLNYLLITLVALLVLMTMLWAHTLKQRIVFYGSTLVSLALTVVMLYATMHIMVLFFYPFLLFITLIIISELYRFMHQEKEQRFIENAFGAYISESLLQNLLQDPMALHLGGKRQHVTVMFSDIRGFTTLSEQLDAEALAKLLNRYFDPMSDAVKQEGGFVDKFIGDAIMAFFNAPVAVEHHAKHACRAALQMLRELKVLNKQLEKEGIAPLRIGIGINSDEVIVGNFGATKRFNYTAIGDGVNVASRIEGLCKTFRVPIIITSKTAALLDETFLTREIEAYTVRGKSEQIMLYELLESNEENRLMCTMYNNAKAMFQKQQYKEANALFHEVNRQYNDLLSQYFITRCEEDERG